MKEEMKVSLENLGRGALGELFDYELTRVLDNILDPNTSDKTREITLKIKIKPDKEKSFCDVQLSAASKIMPINEVKTHLYVGKTPNGNRAVEHNPEQMKLNMQANIPKPETPAKVVNLNQKGEK